MASFLGANGIMEPSFGSLLAMFDYQRLCCFLWPKLWQTDEVMPSHAHI
jgi:hypothetical protein